MPPDRNITPPPQTQIRRPTPVPEADQTQPPQQPPSEPSESGSGVLSAIFGSWVVSWIIIPVAIVLILHFFVFSSFHVVGTSMLPTLQDSDYLVVSKVEHTIASATAHSYIPGRDQIIVFHYPKDPQLDFVKRVIGLPGERVVVNNCNVTIYNSAHPNGFNPDIIHKTNGDCTEGDIDETIPEDNIFVLGDNRTPGGSSDSREWGFLPSKDIIGNVVLRLYPVSSLRIF